MQESSTKFGTILQCRQEVERQLCDQIREAVEVALDEELVAALADGHARRTAEYRSVLLPRYARRTRAVDEAILSCYLAGVNSRRYARRCSRCWGRRICQRALSRGW